MKADEVKDCINVVKHMAIIDIPVVLPVLRLVPGSDCSPPGRVTEETKDSEEVQAPKEPETFSIPVTVEHNLQL